MGEAMSVEMTFTDREIEVIRMALRLQEENHKRNGFNVLVLEVADLRSKIADSLLDNRVNVG